MFYKLNKTAHALTKRKSQNLSDAILLHQVKKANK